MSTRRIGLLVGSLMVLGSRSEEHTSELQSQSNLVCRLLLEKKKLQTTCGIEIVHSIQLTQVQPHIPRPLVHARPRNRPSCFNYYRAASVELFGPCSSTRLRR